MQNAMGIRKESYSYIMMLGHLCADLCWFALSAMLPFLVTIKGMSYTSTAGLMFAMSVFSAITQPLLGAMADKKNRPWLMAAGVFLSGIGISAIGFLDSYAAMLAAVSISSIGSAIYHPDAGRLANFVAGSSKGKGVSNFSFGGNLAGFVGPVLIVFGISQFGMSGSAILLLPTLPMAIWLLLLNKRFLQFAEEGQQEVTAALHKGQKDDWSGFLRLSGVTVLRSAIMATMNSFIPLFWLTVLMQSEEISGLSTTIIAISGALATLFGGRIADRLGFRKVIRLGLLVMVPFMLAIAWSRSVYVSAVLLVPAAVALNLAYSPSVVLGQKLLPNHIGLSSGITMGLASSFGGVVSPLLGVVGDCYGVDTVMWILAGICVVTALSSVILPEDPDKR